MQCNIHQNITTITTNTYNYKDLKQRNQPNEEEKDINNNDNNDNDIINPNLISPHALLITSEPVSLATSSHSNDPLLSQSISHIDSDDLNLEHTPSPSPSPVLKNNNKCQKSPIIVKHEKNENQSEKQVHVEQKEKEYEPVEGIKEGINNDNNVPIISNLNINTIPQHKMYVNPYYKGSKSTPGGDNDDDNEQGEQSDAESDVSGMIQPLVFTIQDDEEKDILHNLNKNKKKSQITDIIQPQFVHNKVGISFMNFYMILFAILCVIIAYYLYLPNSAAQELIKLLVATQNIQNEVEQQTISGQNMQNVQNVLNIQNIQNAVYSRQISAITPTQTAPIKKTQITVNMNKLNQLNQINQFLASISQTTHNQDNINNINPQNGNANMNKKVQESISEIGVMFLSG